MIARAMSELEWVLLNSGVVRGLRQGCVDVAQVLLPHRKEVKLESVLACHNYIAVFHRTNGLQVHLRRIFHLDTSWSMAHVAYHALKDGQTWSPLQAFALCTC